jgi:hypothetical protein
MFRRYLMLDLMYVAATRSSRCFPLPLLSFAASRHCMRERPDHCRPADTSSAEPGRSAAAAPP